MALQKILLTGGTGFFGKALLRNWHKQHKNNNGHAQVTVLTRTPANFLSLYPEFDLLPWLEFHQGDILDPSTLPKGKSYTHILHAATDSTLGPKLSALERYMQIVDGTRNLLEFAVDQNVQRFLLTSSGAVYGPQPQNMERISEDYLGMPDPLNPQSAYGIGKRCAEHLCALYQNRYGIETVVARCFAFVGQDLPLDVHFAIGNFIRDALWCNEITVSGDGSAVRSYLHQSDLAVWLLTILEIGQAGCAYNVGSDEEITIADLAYLVRDIVSPDKPVRILGRVDRDGARSRYIPNIFRAKTELGLDVTMPLMESIKSTVEGVGL